MSGSQGVDALFQATSGPWDCVAGRLSTEETKG